ncbi:hypothetical protein L1987_85581 [Smallanthus sonchifolius]|uniref:Uncharacterized protein n=1 Tax=Smallanthus sonchifolius TaxID=185202 RepID=A0ACB8XY60_9ASTR|nr:hypothetical protein L1987_85581 [Smallanthus sonchifolius]
MRASSGLTGGLDWPKSAFRGEKGMGMVLYAHTSLCFGERIDVYALLGEFRYGDERFGLMLLVLYTLGLGKYVTAWKREKDLSRDMRKNKRTRVGTEAGAILKCGGEILYGRPDQPDHIRRWIGQCFGSKTNRKVRDMVAHQCWVTSGHDRNILHCHIPRPSGLRQNRGHHAKHKPNKKAHGTIKGASKVRIREARDLGHSAHIPIIHEINDFTTKLQW